MERDERRKGAPKVRALLVAEVEPSVVQVSVEAIQETPSCGPEREGLGSGVIYRHDGYVITNNHVVEGAEEVTITFAAGTTEEGEVVGTDPFTDVAVVRVDRQDLPADLAENPDLRLEELAVAVGSPSGFQSAVTAGVISGLNRETPAELTGGRQQVALVDLIQTDAARRATPAGRWQTGTDSQVISINVAYLPPASDVESIGFAIPSSTSVADELIESGEDVGPYLGPA
ncbi:MAG: S1C family serine protease [Actinomycetota bacterium]|nr:S1C family serine protease [Actinomycetota bacterium]